MSDHPQYYLADLPKEARLTPELIAEACRGIRRNRDRCFRHKETGHLVRMLAELAGEWLDGSNTHRRRAVLEGPAHTGFSSETISEGLDRFFSGVTTDSLERLLDQEMGCRRALDRWSADGDGPSHTRKSRARGPHLIANIAGGCLPNPVWVDIILGVLARSAQFVKCASGASFLPRVFLHSLHEKDPLVGACVEIAEWRGGSLPLEEALFAEADCVVATGSDQTLEALRPRIPTRTRFVAHGHRVSLAYVGRERLEAAELGRTMEAVVEDLTAWDQLGCLSPHVVYVETGAALSPAEFAAKLSVALEDREGRTPRGMLPPEDAAAITTHRLAYSVRAAAALGTQIWQSKDSTAWTVVFEEDPAFRLSCLNRFALVKPAAELDAFLTALAPVEGSVSTIGLGVPQPRAAHFATALAHWGATRICPLGKMQSPPVFWRHDGRPPLGDLLTWTDFES